MSTATLPHTAPPHADHSGPGLTPCEEIALDRVIAGLRSGQVNNTALRHLEVDGVLQLDPLLTATGAAPCDE